ncbi:sigma-70 family RNA polymerase sigma factor [Rhizobium sp. RU36D]|uniref:sigma-70 family RNA polymerase sigma factor n=1 Tax=Rhizobium sp. RU36D TaxID=1907415 RepID=UPI0009D7E3F5|nr:sigma-70 family RNA polymerase sigma factor [Rhizobium sp. RU36D]SMD04329.1 RNA polymerase sigma-70 factor, ECF subfamily [Rhizobium sp. RU36D]
MHIDEVAPLLARVALKDRAGFAALYKIASPKLFGICLRILKDRTEAEDALQEVFVRIWNRADSFAAAGNSGIAWICAITRHHCIDRLRVRQPVGAELDEAEELPALEINPEQNAILVSEGKRIDSCMEQLESDRAQAVRFAYVEGVSYQELADRFDVPLNTMRTWLRRSLLKLRECLDQ